MGAILGFLGSPAGQAAHPGFAVALAAASEFGHDGVVSWCQRDVGLARVVNRLGPEAAPRSGQPPRWPPWLWAVASARLDNRADLLAPLDLSSEATDTEIILGAYGRWDTACVEHLLGDFALAVWDGRARRLFCARDRTGVRPLFYTEVGGRFAFASALKALGPLLRRPAEIDGEALAASLMRVPVELHRTVWRDVRRLLPGHSLQLDSSGLSIRRYWRPERTGMPPRSTEDWAGRARELLDDAVRARARRAGPVGLMLSGGLDSSAIAGLAARQGRRLVCATSALALEHRGQQRDERDFVEAVARRLPDLDLEYVCDDGADPASRALIDEALARHVRPVNPYFQTDRALLRSLAARGANVVLSGFGGDMTLSYSGDGWLGELLRRGRLREAVRVARALHDHDGESCRALLRRELPSALLPEWGAWIRRRSRARQRSRRPAVSPAGARRLCAEPSAIPTYAEWLAHRVPLGFQVVEDWSLEAAALGIEASFPFLDSRIVEFLMAVPAVEFVAGGRRRGLLRRAVHDLLPAPILQRTSKGPYVPDYAARMLRHRSDHLNFLAELSAVAERRAFVERHVNLEQIESALGAAVRAHDGPGLTSPIELAAVVGQGLMAARFLWRHLESGPATGGRVP